MKIPVEISHFRNFYINTVYITNYITTTILLWYSSITFLSNNIDMLKFINL